MMGRSLRFPDRFVWGTATSAHQVEGGNHNNDWWAWEQVSGHITDGSTSGSACDWWERAEADFDRAHRMRQNAHRLSVEWSRLEPRPGEWSVEAFDRYRKMLTGLRERGLTPMVTLHHFTNPLWFSDQGGWERRENLRFFQRYVEKVVTELKDLVSLWCVLNEPNVYVYQSYVEGLWPPGKHDTRLAFLVLRHMIQAHVTAYGAINQIDPEAQIGIAHSMRLFDPADPDSRFDRWVAGLRDRIFNQLVLWALNEGVLRFPLSLNERLPDAAGTLDFIGLNYYNRDRVAFDLTGPDQFFAQNVVDSGPEEAPDWWGEEYPQGLYRLLKRLAAYGRPLYVTENGCLDNSDERRPRYLVTHLAAVHRAIHEGVPVRGYFHWSLVDNFEWAEGYSARFGLIHVDFATQERRMKDSGELYAEICRVGGITPQMVEAYAPEVRFEDLALGVFQREKI